MNNYNLKKRQSIVNQIKFNFDPKIKENFYTTEYFLNAKKVLDYKNNQVISTMQFISFCKEPFMMCGAHEVVELLKFYVPKEKLEKLEVFVLEDGTIVNDNQTPLLVIKGYYPDFMCLENLIDGILSRRCSVATNCWRAINELIPGQEIIYMADRNCDYFNQAYDGYAAYVAGINLFVSQAQIEFIKSDQDVKAIGTMPHALIQQYHNHLNELINDFSAINNTDKIVCLLDYENDVLKTLNEILPSFHLLLGIRLDTSSSIIDKSLIDKNLFGVNPELINLVKQWLVNHSLENKKIVVTSRIDSDKIAKINQQTPHVNYYGVGSFFLTPSVHVSADLVEINNFHEAKFGRKLLDNFKNLSKVKWN